MLNFFKSFVLGSCFFTLFFSLAPLSEVSAKGDRSIAGHGPNVDGSVNFEGSDIEPSHWDPTAYHQYEEGNAIGADVFENGQPGNYYQNPNTYDYNFPPNFSPSIENEPGVFSNGK